MTCHFPISKRQVCSRLPILSFSFLAGVLLGGFFLAGDVRAENHAEGSMAVSLSNSGKHVTVNVGGKLFTEFDYSDYDKPILYPIYGPGQIGMTRNWPMKEDVKGEAHDHPHHKSMWISHEINGVDFWGESAGRVTTQKVETEFGGNPKPSNVLRSTSVWRKKSDDKPVLTDQTTYWFGGNEQSRWIDCLVDFQATYGDIQFDDTKEGLLAIRTHPDLRLTAAPKRGVEKVFGSAINCDGITG